MDYQTHNLLVSSQTHIRLRYQAQFSNNLIKFTLFANAYLSGFRMTLFNQWKTSQTLWQLWTKYSCFKWTASLENLSCNMVQIRIRPGCVYLQSLTALAVCMKLSWILGFPYENTDAFCHTGRTHGLLVYESMMTGFLPTWFSCYLTKIQTEVFLFAKVSSFNIQVTITSVMIWSV